MMRSFDISDLSLDDDMAYVNPFHIKEEIEGIKHPFFNFTCKIDGEWVVVICRCKGNPDVVAIEYNRMDEIHDDDDIYQMAINTMARMTIMLVGYEALDEYRPDGSEIGFAYQIKGDDEDGPIFWREPTS